MNSSIWVVARKIDERLIHASGRLQKVRYPANTGGKQFDRLIPRMSVSPPRRVGREVHPDNIDITHSWAPSLFSSSAGWLVASVDSGNKYRMLQFNSVAGTGATWATYGTTRTWNSRPAITAKENSTVTGQPGFVIAGKLRSGDSNNNRIMVSMGVLAQAQIPMGSPTVETGFAPIDTSNSGVYATGGLPAMATFNNGSGGGNVLLTNLPGVGPVLPVRPNTGIQFGSSPSATGDRFFDQGTHVVVARSTSNQIYWTESNQDSQLVP
jgi:hypothetical protein